MKNEEFRKDLRFIDDMHPDLTLALDLADASDAVTMKHFRSATLAVRTKADQSPVSEVDEAVERLIRERLDRERPEDGVVGEEFGSRGSSTRRWIVDPVDGTNNYVRAIPIFATLIALQENGRVTAGVVTAPALGSRWWAAAGEGAFRNGERIRVSRVGMIEHCHISYDSIVDFERFGLGDRFLDLLRRCNRARAFGDFWSHMLVAEGAIEIAIEPQVALWDMAPIEIIVNEAGGRFTDLRGNTRTDGGSGISTNGLVHEEVLGYFA